ncbi:hypothetical protein [Frateuria terrea]|uniref:Uncharacterized protein n=1 Tax=Frateuria terrea TaxID=529704 RepID=A0A1H6X975_9GAMM|nr:hypothetical protein [Frateuria terrea]SEJ24636.1 hypothetical protein SAMN04487997_2821 [Frateuria terrea]SFP59595.1 hypothetical protein SAMN02927913_2798 [Frateuria terrea]
MHRRTCASRGLLQGGDRVEMPPPMALPASRRHWNVASRWPGGWMRPSGGGRGHLPLHAALPALRLMEAT